jgi:hypothetical protein
MNPRLISAGLMALTLTAGCTIPPRAGSPLPPVAEVIPVDDRVAVYGADLDALMRSPDMGDKVRAMFGRDWDGGQLAPARASAYLVGSEPPRRVRIGGADYVAYTGCIPGACGSRRVLILIRDGGSEIFARLDDGGFSHYYSYGNVSREAAQRITDSGMRALDRSSS